MLRAPDGLGDPPLPRRRIADPARRLAEARALVTMLNDPANREQPANVALRHEFGELAARADGALFHDDLSAVNDPVWFHEFMAEAGKHGLRFLGEAALDDGGCGHRARHARDPCTHGPVQPRAIPRFRSRPSIPADASMPRRPDARRPSAPGAPFRALGDRAEASFAERPGLSCSCTGFRRRRRCVGARRCRSRRRSRVAARSRRSVAASPHRPRPGAYVSRALRRAGRRRVPPHLAEMLVGAYGAAAIELHLFVPPIAYTPGERPYVGRVVPLQLAAGNRVTNLWHETSTWTIPSRGSSSCCWMALATARRCRRRSARRSGPRATNRPRRRSSNTCSILRSLRCCSRSVLRRDALCDDIVAIGRADRRRRPIKLTAESKSR